MKIACMLEIFVTCTNGWMFDNTPQSVDGDRRDAEPQLIGALYLEGSQGSKFLDLTKYKLKPYY